ncbi:uncharacterized protein LOC117340864 isoform X2 [Pecten maximus]|uniref:uncharacterized protein LOC117340864 isoform X2 n=1 Tax=Pecten maximus TaxID=6579 RepID=UPI0014585E18|nr:uncharacterized protein LOC117340864 isoform X2 [Pecten maximus]
MATDDFHVILNDLEVDARPLYGSEMDTNDLRERPHVLPPDNIMTKLEASKVSNSKLWRKKSGDVDLDFLKSLWNFSSVSVPVRLESRVSVDGEKKSVSENLSEEEDESFQNDLNYGNRGPNGMYSSATGIKGKNSVSWKTDSENVLNKLESPKLDKPERGTPVKPARTGTRNSKSTSSQKTFHQDNSAEPVLGFDEEFASLSEQNYCEQDLSQGTNILIFNDDRDHFISDSNRTNFDVNQLDGYPLEHQTFEHHAFQEYQTFEDPPNLEDGNIPEIERESIIRDFQRQNSGNYRSFEAEEHYSSFEAEGNYSSFEAQANMPREMFPTESQSRSHIPERGGNPETNPFLNTFSDEISYGNTVGLENYSSELPNRRSNTSHQHSDTCRHESPVPAQDNNRHSKNGRSAVLISKAGCGNCQNCRASRMIDHMEKLAESAGFDIHDVLPDGNCMFRAIVDQLRMRGDLTMTAGKLRQNVVQYLRDNPCSEDGTHMQMFLPTEKWDDYLSRMEKDGEWGDEMALRGISEVIKRQIKIISALGTDQHNQITIQPTGVESDQSQDLFLGHMDDYHYISLRPQNWEDTWFVRARERRRPTKQKTDQYGDDTIRVRGMDSPIEHGCVDDYFADDTAVDSISTTPIGHLSYVLKNVLNTKYLVVQDPQIWDDKMESLNNHPRSSTVALTVGSVVEKFAVSVQDKSPVQIGYSLRKDKIASAGSMEVTPQVLVVYPYYRIIKRDSDQTSSQKDMVMETNGLHPGFIRLHYPIKSSTPRTSQGQLLVSYLPNSYLDASSVRRDLGSFQIPQFLEENLSIGYALQGHFWPECASEWKSRDRPSGWPKPEFIKSIIDDGFLIIAVSHPHSNKPDLEFEISFAKAEKLLARKNMTKCQRNCFHIFKVLVDFHTRQTPLLSTNYLKMVFFYASEVVPRSQWRVNPGAAILYLVDRLLQCLRIKQLPHYFIHSNNMIDHFSDDALQQIVTHLEALRQFPVTAIVLLAESHGLTSSWMADPIIEDIPVFTEHRDLQKSFAEVFIPTTLKNAINYVKYMMLQPAADVIMEAYRDMKMTSESKPGYAWCVGDIFEFIHQILSELHFFQQFWLCLVLDMTHGTSTVKALTRRLPGKTIKEILGNDEEGELDSILVPFSVMDNSCVRSATESEADPELTFLHSLATHLVNMEKYELSAHYLRAAVSLTRRRIDEITKNSNFSSKSGETSDIDRQSPKLNSLDFSRQHALKMYLNNFLVQLFNSYHYNGQTELFQEYIGDLQEVCDTISAPYAYRNLSRIWGYLGCDDRAQKAADRMEEMFQLCGV